MEICGLYNIPSFTKASGRMHAELWGEGIGKNISNDNLVELMVPLVRRK